MFEVKRAGDAGPGAWDHLVVATGNDGQYHRWGEYWQQYHRWGEYWQQYHRCRQRKGSLAAVAQVRWQ